MSAGIIEQNENCVFEVEVTVKASDQHVAYDRAEKLAYMIADNRNKILSVTRYEVTETSPTDVVGERNWTYKFN